MVAVMALTVLATKSTFEGYIGEPAVIGFVRRGDPASAELIALLEALAPVHGPRVGFALVDVRASPELATYGGVAGAPTAALFDDYRPRGVLGDPITRAALEDLITTRLR